MSRARDNSFWHHYIELLGASQSHITLQLHLWQRQSSETWALKVFSDCYEKSHSLQTCLSMLHGNTLVYTFDFASTDAMKA